MGTKQLTLTQKAKWTPVILERDFPNGITPTCLYCGQNFIDNDPDYDREWDHLDCNRRNNTPENLAWAHRRCNILKERKLDWQYIAQDKKKQNEKWHGGSLGEREGNKTAHTQMQPNEQIDANADAALETEKYLTERLLPLPGKIPAEQRLDFTEAADVIAYRCYKKHGHGSQNTITRILKMLTCDDSPFDRVKQDGRTWIVRRTGN